MKQFMVSEDAMLLLVSNVAAVANYKHKQLSAAEGASKPGASSRCCSSSSTARQDSAGSSAAVQAPAHHKQLLQALGLQDSQLGCAMEDFPTLRATTAVQGLLKAMLEEHEQYLLAGDEAVTAGRSGGCDRGRGSSSGSTGRHSSTTGNRTNTNKNSTSSTAASRSSSEVQKAGMPRQLVLPLLLVLAELCTQSPTAADMCDLLQAIQHCILLLCEVLTEENRGALAAKLVQMLLQLTGSAVQRLLQQPCTGDSSIRVAVVAEFTKLWQLLSVMGE
jgi:hypothetical protein